MTEKRFTSWGNRIKRNGKLLNIEFKTKTDAKLCCDNWDYDRMKHTVREIAEIIGYNGTINPKR